MLYDIIDIEGNKLPDNQSGFEGIPGPIYVFIGGLFNLAGWANGETLRRTLSKLSSESGAKAQAFFIQEKKESPWDEKLYNAYRFGRDGNISREAEELAHAIFLPAGPMKELSASDSPAFEKALGDLQNHFSRVTLLGYSMGTSLIRQMETYIVQELEKKGLTEEQIRSVVQCGVSLDAGPLYTAVENEVFNSGKTLTHFITVHRDDMMTNRVGNLLGDFVYPERSKGAMVTAAEIGNSFVVVPEIGSPTVRAVSQSATPPSSSNLHFLEFQEAHDVLMYINIRETLSSETETVASYPSIPSARLMREFNAIAGAAAAKAVRDGVPRNGPSLIEEFRRVNMAPRRLKKLQKEFSRDERYFEQHVAAGREPQYIPTFYMPTDLLKKVEEDAKARKANPAAYRQPLPNAKYAGLVTNL